MPRFSIEFHSEGVEYVAHVETHYFESHATYRATLKPKGSEQAEFPVEITLDEGWEQTDDSKAQGVLPGALITDLGEAIERYDG